jgi:hypothetical protein
VVVVDVVEVVLVLVVEVVVVEVVLVVVVSEMHHAENTALIRWSGRNNVPPMREVLEMPFGFKLIVWA